MGKRISTPDILPTIHLPVGPSSCRARFPFHFHRLSHEESLYRPLRTSYPWL